MERTYGMPDTANELKRKKVRKQAMETMLADSINRMREARDADDDRAVTAERIKISQITTFMTRISDEIYELEKKLGIAKQ